MRYSASGCIVIDMGEEGQFYRSRGFRRKAVEAKDAESAPFPDLPGTAAIAVKTIVYLNVHLGKEPREIVAAYPRRVTLQEVYLALALYHQNPAAIDAELKRDGELNSIGVLKGDSLSVPSVGLRSLAELASE